MPKIKDLDGQRFSNLVVLKYLGIEKHKAQWQCKCDCGNIAIVSSSNLIAGNTKSCGCLKPKYVDLTGKKFGNLIVMKRINNNKRGEAVWECHCKCGNIVYTTSGSLNSGNTQGCGCKSKETAKLRSIKNHKDSRLYKVYHWMKQRCYDKNNKQYKNYGGRGIKICDEWLSDYTKFYDWAVNNGYEKGLTIDRKNNNGNYEPNNCQWVTQKVNNNNRRSSIYLSYGGKTQTIYDWSIETGINHFTLLYRFHKKWPPEKILNKL